MEELRKLFVHFLTTDMKGEYATAIFDKDGNPLWNKVTLDMILYNFDKTVQELSK